MKVNNLNFDCYGYITFYSTTNLRDDLHFYDDSLLELLFHYLDFFIYNIFSSNKCIRSTGNAQVH